MPLSFWAWLVAIDCSGAKLRTTLSVPPPGALGTIMRMGRDG